MTTQVASIGCIVASLPSNGGVTLHPDEPLPDHIETLKAMLLSERSARLAAEADARERALMIEKLKHIIAKLRHERFGQSSERSALLEQLELQLFELEEDTAQATPFGEPSYPDALQVVVSVYDREVRDIKAFAWSAEASAYVETSFEES